MNDMESQKTDIADAHHFPPPSLPDMNVCRARHGGFSSFAYCLVPSPDLCAHALSFGYSHFCQHPDRLQIARRTAAEK